MDVVDDGAAAAVAAKTYDLVLMDMQMPKMDGAMATRTIRARESAARRLPIIAVTVDIVRENQEAFLAAGVTSLIAKLIDWPELARIIERCAAEKA